jgi:hypothetical protein
MNIQSHSVSERHLKKKRGRVRRAKGAGLERESLRARPPAATTRRKIDFGVAHERLIGTARA